MTQSWHFTVYDYNLNRLMMLWVLSGGFDSHHSSELEKNTRLTYQSATMPTHRATE